MGVWSRGSGRTHGDRSQSVHRQPRWHRRRQPDGLGGQGRRARALDGRAARRAGRRRTRAPTKFPTVAEIEAQIETRNYRRGTGSLFVSNRGNVKKLEPMPKNPTIQDFFRLRFAPANHVLQSATRALKTGMSEEIILACLLHDCVLNADQAGSRLVGRAAVRALHPREVDVRDPLSPDAALLRRKPTPATNTRTSTSGSSAKTTNRRRTSKRPTRCSATTSGTWSRAS